VATHRSAAKRARQIPRRTKRNTALRQRVRTALRGFRETLAAGDSTQAAEQFKTVAKELHKAASRGVLHRRNVSRRVSRAAKRVASLTSKA
jgi:small subunit ribosomal protein S20